MCGVRNEFLACVRISNPSTGHSATNIKRKLVCDYTEFIAMWGCCVHHFIPIIVSNKLRIDFVMVIKELHNTKNPLPRKMSKPNVAIKYCVCLSDQNHLVIAFAFRSKGVFHYGFLAPIFDAILRMRKAP